MYRCFSRGRFLYVRILFLLFLIFPVQNSFSLEPSSAGLEGIFISGSVEQMFAPGELSEYVSPKPGWRAGAGWSFVLNERHSFPFYFESGFSFVSGTNPLVRTFDIYPFTVYGGWTFSPLKFLDISIQLGAGGYFGRVEHYETALALAEGTLTATEGGGFLAGAKLGGGVSLFERSVEIHLYGTLECIIERDGPVPLPGVNLTCRFYPLKIYSVLKK